jgi:hypothetical protein
VFQIFQLGQNVPWFGVERMCLQGAGEKVQDIVVGGLRQRRIAAIGKFCRIRHRMPSSPEAK